MEFMFINFLNAQGQPINYWFTTMPIFGKTVKGSLTDRLRGFVTINNAYGLEYSMGGLGNSIGSHGPFGVYANEKHIAVIQPTINSNRAFHQSVISISGVLATSAGYESDLLDRLSKLFDEGKATSIVYSGNMEEIIESQIISKSQFEQIYDRQEQLQNLLAKINKLSLKLGEKRIFEKRNKLLGLLQRNKDLNAKLANVFGETQSQKIGR